jgi:hypothetical protein
MLMNFALRETVHCTEAEERIAVDVGVRCRWMVCSLLTFVFTSRFLCSMSTISTATGEVHLWSDIRVNSMATIGRDIEKS